MFLGSATTLWILPLHVFNMPPLTCMSILRQLHVLPIRCSLQITLIRDLGRVKPHGHMSSCKMPRAANHTFVVENMSTGSVITMKTSLFLRTLLLQPLPFLLLPPPSNRTLFPQSLVQMATLFSSTWIMILRRSSIRYHPMPVRFWTLALLIRPLVLPTCTAIPRSSFPLWMGRFDELQATLFIVLYVNMVLELMRARSVSFWAPW